MTVIFSASEWMNEPMPFITIPSLAPIEANGCGDFFPEASSSPVRALEAQEARRLMRAIELVNLPGLNSATDEPTLPHPLLGITAEPTMIDKPIDLLVRELRGWRRHEIPGGWVLAILPRSAPEGWDQVAGVIQKKVAPMPMPEFWPMGFVAWERIGYPRWLDDERERTARKSDDQMFIGMIEASDGRVPPEKPQ